MTTQLRFGNLTYYYEEVVKQAINAYVQRYGMFWSDRPEFQSTPENWETLQSLVDAYCINRAWQAYPDAMEDVLGGEVDPNMMFMNMILDGWHTRWMVTNVELANRASGFLANTFMGSVPATRQQLHNLALDHARNCRRDREEVSITHAMEMYALDQGWDIEAAAERRTSNVELAVEGGRRRRRQRLTEQIIQGPMAELGSNVHNRLRFLMR